MVWGIFPVDPLSGEDKYYIFTKGTYKVGRKGCDVTISKDKGASRVHAEIIVDAMQSFDCLKKRSSKLPSRVRIKDCSKYGTFIGRNDGPKEKVHEYPNKETELKDGDLISFGTGSATYRFCFVPFVFYVCDSSSSQVTRSIQDIASAIGACVMQKWSKECTHVIIDPFTPLNEDLLDAIISKKPFVLHNWLESLAEHRICTEIPSFSSYVPTLTVDGTSVTLADTNAREICLREYAFLLDSEPMYKFGNKLRFLLEFSGAKVLSIEAFDKYSQELEDGECKRLVYVFSPGSVDRSQNRGSLSKISEINLVRSALSGYLDQSFLIAPSIAVSSTCSTEETIVADSDAETESATSSQPPAKDERKGESSRDYACLSSETDRTTRRMERSDKTTVIEVKDDEYTDRSNKTTVIEVKDDESANDKIDKEASTDTAVKSPESCHITSFVERGCKTGIKVKKDHESEGRDSDILYSQSLIVRDIHQPARVGSVTSNNVVNFKRFRKTETQSGNSFHNLVPFSKHAYADFDIDNKEVIDSTKEEKKRKEMEALAEDLFNSEKGRRRTGGSVRALLSRH